MSTPTISAAARETYRATRQHTGSPRLAALAMTAHHGISAADAHAYSWVAETGAPPPAGARHCGADRRLAA